MIFYFVEKECACSFVAFIVVCVQTSPYYVELVIHKNATYTHKHLTGNTVWRSEISLHLTTLYCFLQKFLFLVSNFQYLLRLRYTNNILNSIWKFLFSRPKFSKGTLISLIATIVGYTYVCIDLTYC